MFICFPPRSFSGLSNSDSQTAESQRKSKSTGSAISLSTRASSFRNDSEWIEITIAQPILATITAIIRVNALDGQDVSEVDLPDRRLQAAGMGEVAKIAIVAKAGRILAAVPERRLGCRAEGCDIDLHLSCDCYPYRKSRPPAVEKTYGLWSYQHPAPKMQLFRDK